jgi:DNA-binding GntR family transcriptional regulator
MVHTTDTRDASRRPEGSAPGGPARKSEAAVESRIERSAPDRLAEAIRADILRGVLPPGSSIGQAEVAAAHGVSRVPAREALQRLAAEGLLELRGGTTARVPAMSVEDLQELYDLRIAIEPAASALGVPNVGRAELLQMHEQCRIMETTHDPVAWLEANARFHELIYTRANRARTAKLIGDLRRQIDRYLFVHVALVGNKERLEDEHGHIINAAEAGDAAAVERLLKAHFIVGHDLILQDILKLSLPPAERRPEPARRHR